MNTPERGEDDWKKATDTLKELIEQGEQVDKRCWRTTHKTGKYGRWLVHIVCDGIDASDALIDAGLARPYWGGTKSTEPW